MRGACRLGPSVTDKDHHQSRPIHGTGVADVSALVGCSNLHTLNLRATPVTDISALANCSNLHTLNLSITQVTDVSALAHCRKLKKLILRDTALDVTSLELLGDGVEVLR